MNEMDGMILASAPMLCSLASLRSATATARELGSSPATILRRLSALEEALETPLFNRTTSGLEPTAALELVLPWAERACACAVGMQRELAQLERAPVGVVRLAIPPAMARLMVVPGLSELAKRAPGILLELAVANAVVDLEGREADLALRGVRPAKGDLIMQRLATYDLVVAVSPTLLQGWNKDLHSLPWLDWDTSLQELPESRWLRALPGAQVVFRASDLESLLAAASRGVGALVVSEPMAALTGGLVKIAAPGLPKGELWLVTHSGLREIPRVKAVWDWLIAHLTQMSLELSFELAHHDL